MRKFLALVTLWGACSSEIGALPVVPSPAGGDGDDIIGPISYEPSNISQTTLEAGVGALTLPSGPSTIDTVAGTISNAGGSLLPTGAVFTAVPQTDAPTLGVFALASIAIEEGAEVTVVGANALVFAVNGKVSIAGQLNASARDNVAGPGGFNGGLEDNENGLGPGGGQSAVNNTGGGGGGYLATGGAGGAGDNNNTPGPAGTVYGTEGLSPLLGGSGGARGAGGDGGIGGGGGGAVQISSRESITITATGAIFAGGAGGTGGDNDDGGGGGGAGGAILLEAALVDLTGSLSVNGGGGGAGANSATVGLDGQDASLSSSAATGGVGAGNGGTGGNGGAGEAAAGSVGATAADGGGGGGGSGGRMLIRTRSPAKLTGTVTPTAAMTSEDL